MVDLKPHGPVALPRANALPVRHTGEVEGHGPRVVDVGRGAIGHSGPGRDVEGPWCAGVHRLEAANLLRVDVANEAVVLPVVGLAHILPVAPSTAYQHLWKCVVAAGAHRRAKSEGNAHQHSGRRGGCVR